MDKILRLLFNVKELRSRGNDDDFADRLTRTYTTTLLFLFCIIVTSSHYVGNVIQCWCPAEFTPSHREYANTVCWVSNTYYVAMEEQIPVSLQASERSKQISYYQWIPFILLAQAVLCLVPRLIWKFLSGRSGVSIANFVGMSMSGQRQSYADMRDKTAKFVAFQLDRYLRTRRAKDRLFHGGRTQTPCSKCCADLRAEYHGSYLTICYLITKVVYICNAVAQLYLLDCFLGMEFHFWGIYEMKRIFTGELHGAGEGRFPTVTLCSFQVRRQTQIHTHILQCVLPINLFNERLFLFLWFWFALLALVSTYSVFSWLIILCYPPSRVQYIRRQLALHHPQAARKDKPKVTRFTSNHLRRDGVLIARLLGQNAGCLAVAETVCAMWECYAPDFKYTVERVDHRNNGDYASLPVNDSAIRLSYRREEV